MCFKSGRANSCEMENMKTSLQCHEAMLRGIEPRVQGEHWSAGRVVALAALGSSRAVPADALALCGVDYLVVGPKVLATLKDSQTLQVCPLLLAPL